MLCRKKGWIFLDTIFNYLSGTAFFVGMNIICKHLKGLRLTIRNL